VRGTFCRECGWDGEVMDREDEEYLADVDLPQGYSDEDPEDFDYEETLRREGLLPKREDEAGRPSPGASAFGALVYVFLALVVIAVIVLVAVLRRH
jgi:hypothetical protein